MASSSTTNHVGSRGFEFAWRSVASIDGWLTEDQGRELFNAARCSKDRDWIVEVGSHHGRSTILLAKAKRPDVRLLAVDPFSDARWGGGAESLEAFKTNLRDHGVAADVRLHRGTSETAWMECAQESVGFVYLDGAHDRRSVLADIDIWAPRLQPGSQLYLHDAFSSPGVSAAVMQRMLWNRSFSYRGSRGSLVMFERADPSVLSSVTSSLCLLARLSYLARNVAIKIAMRRGWSWLPPRVGHEGPDYPF
jgi:predicted O-methyltransferase YrrM